MDILTGEKVEHEAWLLVHICEYHGKPLGVHNSNHKLALQPEKVQKLDKTVRYNTQDSSERHTIHYGSSEYAKL